MAKYALFMAKWKRDVYKRFVKQLSQQEQLLKLNKASVGGS